MEELVNFKTRHTPRYISQQGLTSYAPDIPPEKQTVHRMQKHTSYLRLLNGMCSTLQIHCSFFIQPIPQIGKSLVAEENVAIKMEQSRLAEVYSELTTSLMTLKKENVDIYNLGQIFAAEKGRIYSDHIHYYIYPNEIVSKGNQIVWKEITEKIALSWKFTKK